jgi:hypothetical protein
MNLEIDTPSYTNKHNVSLQYIVQFSKLLIEESKENRMFQIAKLYV